MPKGNNKEDPLKLLELFDMESGKAWTKWNEKQKKHK
jgi:hypothetical protein